MRIEGLNRDTLEMGRQSYSDELVGHTRFSYPRAGVARRVVLGSFGKLIAQFLLLLRHLVLIPLFLVGWGNEGYGEWLTIAALCAYIPLIDMGIHNYVINLLNQSYSRSDLTQFNRILSSSLALYCLVFCFVFALVVCIATVVPIAGWLNIVNVPSVVVKQTVVLMALLLLLKIPYGMLRGVYRSIGELPCETMFANIEILLAVVLTGAVLMLKGGFVSVILVQIAALVCALLAMVKDLLRRHPEIRFSIKYVDLLLSLSFIAPGVFFFFETLAVLIKVQGPLLLLNITLGGVHVAAFSVHRTLTNFVSQFIGGIAIALHPEITAMEARGDYVNLQRVYLSMTKCLLLIAFVLLSILFFVGRDLMCIWLKGKVSFDVSLWILLLIALALTSFQSVVALVQRATNKHRLYCSCFLVSSVVGILLAIPFVRMWGVNGVVLGFIVSEFFFLHMVIPNRSCEILLLERKHFWISCIVRGVPVLVLQMIVLYGVDIFCTGHPVWKLLSVGTVSLVFGGALSFLIWFEASERHILVSFFRRISGRIVSSWF